MAAPVVAIDAGHGGSDYGAIYNGRNEKDDNLKLAMAVGKILENNSVDVFYIRTTDEYETPFKKATDANNSNADYFISIHRNSSATPGEYNGVQSLVFDDSGIKAQIARNINKNLTDIGFKDLGVDERPNLVVLKRTKMPAVLVEAGFINNEKDNRLFDDNFDAIAQGIADGILQSIMPSKNNYESDATLNSSSSEADNTQTTNAKETATFESESDISSAETTSDTPNMAAANVSSSNIAAATGNGANTNATHVISDEEINEPLYRVQVGAYRKKDNAERMLNSLLIEGFPAFIIYEDGLYKVQVGAFRFLANAVKMEQRLRKYRYNTYIVYS
ncbi:MAG: N-acetylmuramoyl-L-alanine amidase [Lachnospira sp.]|nr:N-acetylmuramoyl-L-alanine amidase [Lachnospira sp.]